ncbi:hypothetical protein GCM10023189_27560 [Nibrella saemangeumensis]|uniref:DUF4249 domain-containing protein n=1 Tax=Nibrella saemangeumensis TaxID=1084526 RepID=A0ABP8MZ67_9BACT
MRSVTLSVLIGLFTVVFACVDLIELPQVNNKDILLVEGTLTNLPEPQVIKLSRAQADPATGLFRNVPVTKAVMEVVVNASEVVACHETLEGHYQLPNDFRGKVGHSYQLRFTLSDGSKYQSNQQVMADVPSIDRVTARFNPTSLSAQLLKGYRAAHDIFIDSQDPADQKNFYRWEWKLWGRQYWCHSCRQGVYSVYKVLPNTYRGRDYFVTGDERYEDCFRPPAGKAAEEAPEVPQEDWTYDYGCRTPCWQIIYGYDIVVLDDQFINGRLINQQRVAQIPYYDAAPCLVDIRQTSLTPDAYRYYKLFQEQTQHTGGLADTPPTVLGGNVRQVNDPQGSVVGYFSASAVSLVHFWLDRKDAEGLSYGSYGALSTVDTTRPEGTYGSGGDGLFYAIHQRMPNLEPSPPYLGERARPKVRLWPTNDRPPLAPCLQNDQQTPFKPEGWRD